MTLQERLDEALHVWTANSANNKLIINEIIIPREDEIEFREIPKLGEVQAEPIAYNGLVFAGIWTGVNVYLGDKLEFRSIPPKPWGMSRGN